MPLYVKATFKGQKVWARADAAGGLLADAKGLVPYRYKPNGKDYQTRPDRLRADSGAVPKDLGETGRAGEGGSTSHTSSKRRASSKAATLRTWRPEEEAVQLWTDGACTGNPGPSGWGVHYRHRGEVREANGYLGIGTNNIAELTAILEGLRMVEDPSGPVDVMTDSSYCVGLLTQGWKAKANQELVAELRAEAKRFTDLRIVKVKGHAGVEGNEAADQLAVGAIHGR